MSLRAWGRYRREYAGRANCFSQTIYGYAAAVAPMNRLGAINTDAHFDHNGGNGFFRSLGISNLNAGGPEHWRIWLESLNRIEALDPAAVVPSHGPVARGADVARIIGEVRRELEEAPGHEGTV